MRRTVMLAILAFLSSAAVPVADVAAQGPAEPRLVCDRGPAATKTYGGTSWDIYGCNDNRSVAVVTARGNPGAPFYFLFVERDGQFQLSGEGTGLPTITRRAFDDLRRLSDQDIKALVRETQKGPRSPQ